ncbi:hypothetical protein XYCOK13_18560 [Xylanibacillus composti]|uniref:Uncharacterized protein n=1 Tax=Xylanibacillus composti TaxID=1572762 RepID=A0A8J4H164_9BACL|nr:hypothetical protein XYCOK13_18560 [Xylanibacillus composti]
MRVFSCMCADETSPQEAAANPKYRGNEFAPFTQMSYNDRSIYLDCGHLLDGADVPGKLSRAKGASDETKPDEG